MFVTSPSKPGRVGSPLYFLAVCVQPFPFFGVDAKFKRTTCVISVVFELSPF